MSHVLSCMYSLLHVSGNFRNDMYICWPIAMHCRYDYSGIDRRPDFTWPGHPVEAVNVLWLPPILADACGVSMSLQQLCSAPQLIIKKWLLLLLLISEIVQLTDLPLCRCRRQEACRLCGHKSGVVQFQ